MTVGLLKAAEEMGLRCPEDFGLVSFDDYPWLGVFRPRLTTVELPKHQLGIEAAELLIRRIGGDRSKAVVTEAAAGIADSRIVRVCAARFARAIFGARAGKSKQRVGSGLAVAMVVVAFFASCLQITFR